ncbi:hypothetical protein [Scytonema sp. PRP1]
MVDWSGYLNSVCQAYDKWWQVYTFTDVLGRNNPQTQMIFTTRNLGVGGD